MSKRQQKRKQRDQVWLAEQWRTVRAALTEWFSGEYYNNNKKQQATQPQQVQQVQHEDKH